jgi:hypothetical protein
MHNYVLDNYAMSYYKCRYGKVQERSTKGAVQGAHIYIERYGALASGIEY